MHFVCIFSEVENTNNYTNLRGNLVPMSKVSWLQPVKRRMNTLSSLASWASLSLGYFCICNEVTIKLQQRPIDCIDR